MPDRLLYRYNVGEVLRYKVVLSMLLTEPRSAQQAGEAELESTCTVLHQHDDGSWTVELKSRAVRLEGVMQGDLPDFLCDRLAVLRMNALGTLLDTDGTPPPVRIAAFPHEPVEEGTQWTVTDASGPQPLEVTYIVQGLAETEDGTVATLVSTAQTENEDEGLHTSVQSTLAFSVAGGRLLASTTVIEMKWRGGRSVDMVLENQLVDQTHQETQLGHLG